jgi:hypothetical protein
MKDIGILKQVRELNRLVSEDRILPKDFELLVNEGLDPVVVETWKKYAFISKLNNAAIHSMLIQDIEKLSHKPSLFERVLKKIGL